jgi:hypothetical protein
VPKRIKNKFLLSLSKKANGESYANLYAKRDGYKYQKKYISQFVTITRWVKECIKIMEKDEGLTTNDIYKLIVDKKYKLVKA